jgi:hypothetical protein
VSFVGGAFQVIFVVHLKGPGQHVVHHHQTDVDPGTLDAVKAIELR